MNKATFEKIERKVETQLFHVMSDWYFLQPTQPIDMPKERET